MRIPNTISFYAIRGLIQKHPEEDTEEASGYYLRISIKRLLYFKLYIEDR